MLIGDHPDHFGPCSHPALIPRTPPFAVVRRRVDNLLTCRDGSQQSAEVRSKHVRNVEVGGSSPLTSTPVVEFATFSQAADSFVSGRSPLRANCGLRRRQSWPRSQRGPADACTKLVAGLFGLAADRSAR
jgi:hypothetical protein